MCCARTSRTPEIAARIRTLLRGSIDWEYLLRTADVHGMAPLLYWHLNACSGAIPQNAFGHLQGNFRANSLHNLFLTGELLRLLNTCEAHGITVIPYKGPTLAASVYGNLALRRFIDLDIIVRRHDVPKAKEILASLGYRPQYRLTRAQEIALLGSRGTYVFTRDDEKKSDIELHWEIAEHFSLPLDPERLWERLKQMTLGGETVPTLSPEDTLLILCAHGFKHLWERLEWICDVSELIRVCPHMKWDQVMAEAEGLGGERMLLLGLFLASNLLEADVPDWISRRAHADPTVKTLARRIREALFREDNGLGDLFEGAYFRPLHLKTKERLADKVRYCICAVTTPNIEDLKLLPLPSLLSSFYYMLRPMRLIGKYGLRTLKRLL